MVPTPDLSKGGLFNRLVSGPGASRDELHRLASRVGIERDSKPIPIAARTRIDLVVVGAVAVDASGRRIGRGGGADDLTFAMAASNRSVGKDTLVCCTVHDCQVFEHLPPDLFGAHDLPVDLVATPTRVIRVRSRLDKPCRILWGLLSRERFAQVGVLREMQFKEGRAGVDVRLKEDLQEEVVADEDRAGGSRANKTEAVRATRRGRKGDGINKVMPNGKEEEAEPKRQAEEDAATAEKGHSTKKQQGSKTQPPRKNVSKDAGGGPEEAEEPSRRILTIFLGRIPRSCRARELKDELQSRGVSPGSRGLSLVWKGGKGVAFLNVDETASKLSHDEIVSRMRGIQLREQPLNVQGHEQGGGGGKRNSKSREAENQKLVSGIVDDMLRVAVSRASSDF